jgi:signal transduction histidine kinase
MRIFQTSLRRKLVFLITTIASLTVLIANIGLGLSEWQEARRVIVEQENAASQITAAASAAALLFGDTTAANETLAALHNKGRIRMACLYNEQGQIMGSFVDPRSPGPLCPDKSQAVPVSSLRRLSIVKPVSVKGHIVGLLYTDLRLAELRRLAISLAETTALATVLASLFALLVSMLTQRWISGPIVRLTETAIKIAERGSNGLRARRTSDDEVGVLIDQFNLMLDRLNKRENELRESYEQLEAKVLERTSELRGEIAERKLVELDLNHAKEVAEEANRAKSSFLANMSHELRTPLNAIIGYSEMLFEDAQEAPDALQNGMKGDLQKILSSARHLLSLISDVLDLSKIEAGQMSVSMEHMSVDALLQDVLPIAEVLVKTNSNVLDIQTPRGNLYTTVDPLRFRQALLNLLGNAAKFTTNGRIELSTLVQMKDGKSWIVFSVSDTGIGIAQEQIPKLFRPFSQVDASARRRYGGTGLGLCISQQLCRAMAGWIEVKSQLNSGSVFSIWMPLDTQAT